MAVSFPRLPRWLCGGGGNTKKDSKGSPPSLNHSLKKSKTGSSSLKKMKRGGGEEGKMGNVLFPEPDDPEWSIGWVEPHGPGFKSEDDTGGGGGFVVLVPCYKKVIGGSGNQIPTAGFLSPATTDGKNIEQWLSSMGKL
ncbi:hypothetical protein Rs2_27345 [Raphanus sativus]|uniref:Uncharacterized protein LOC108835767 n=1 Tax=Raphanus sativus TaxID=3726 RepID=A0A6J0LWR1_RAPSA|nr:uncharacterized protein LOC108835767 [Raphanus sativus]XP_056845255.1 uncharacterized protein LOC108835767 [Raphanus sativus]KAJ4887597.1 hypothetical protein Rs2_27345 [Raphanus sativus]